MSKVVPTAEFASIVYGAAEAPADDPAEDFHEASRLYPNIAPGRLSTLVDLARDPELQQTVARASRLYEHAPTIDLPAPRLPKVPLQNALDRRASTLTDMPSGINLGTLSALLGASYRSRDRGPGVARRPVPSGGALYPVELYPIPLAVEGVDSAVYHYHPYRHCLERLADVTPAAVRASLVDQNVADRAAALVVVTGMFWRSRFKYGLRGYRFVLLEAGHVVQNALLVAAALGVTALPLGGFYDNRLDALVGADGIDEATVYAFVVGGRA
ncbi:MAG: SagB family peptide dehydrogenase [Actinomycetes bacterium]